MSHDIYGWAPKGTHAISLFATQQRAIFPHYKPVKTLQWANPIYRTRQQSTTIAPHFANLPNLTMSACHKNKTRAINFAKLHMECYRPLLQRQPKKSMRFVAHAHDRYSRTTKLSNKHSQNRIKNASNCAPASWTSRCTCVPTIARPMRKKASKPSAQTICKQRNAHAI